MTDDWPVTRVMTGMSTVPVSHAIDLAMFFPMEEPARHDAIIVETRRHLGGCCHAIETALRASLAHAPEVVAALKFRPGPVCWPTVRAEPTLLGPALLSHMQLRAGTSLMLRQFGQPDGERPDAGEAAPPWPNDDPAISDALGGLALAEGRWVAAGGEDHPMQPDLPAEYFADLVWTATACLAAAVERSVPDTRNAMMAAFERSGWALLADHDESASPISQADHLVRRMGGQAATPELLGMALGQRRFLLFAALVARRLRIDVTQVTEILVMAPVREVAMLCRGLGGSDADYRHLLLALRPVRPALSDAAIVAAAECYPLLSEHQADAALDIFRMPAALRAKLHHLRSVAGATVSA